MSEFALIYINIYISNPVLGFSSADVLSTKLYYIMESTVDNYEERKNTIYEIYIYKYIHTYQEREISLIYIYI